MKEQVFIITLEIRVVDDLYVPEHSMQAWAEDMAATLQRRQAPWEIKAVEVKEIPDFSG